MKTTATADQARRTELEIACDACHHVAYYVAIPPAGSEAPARYSCAHHAYPLTDFTHLPR